MKANQIMKNKNKIKIKIKNQGLERRLLRKGILCNNLRRTLKSGPYNNVFKSEQRLKWTKCKYQNGIGTSVRNVSQILADEMANFKNLLSQNMFMKKTNEKEKNNKKGNSPIKRGAL